MKSVQLGYLLICVYVSQSLAWGPEGHKIVAQLGANRLSPAAKNFVQDFIGDSSRYNNLPAIAPLPDEYDHNAAGRWSSSCHYCNLPRDATHFQMSYCPNCCVVKAIMNYTNLLTKEVSNPTPCQFAPSEEPCPLEFLVHFVGDVHQPLHVSYAYDEGGNFVNVTFFGKHHNLHAVWDSYIIERWNPDWTAGAEELENYISAHPGLEEKFTSDMDPISWADESFQFVLSNVYKFKSVNGVGQLGEEYYDTNLPVIQLRLIAAGVRLGKLLNTILESSN